MDLLFRRHRDFVFRLGWSFTGSRDLAQDVVQEVSREFTKSHFEHSSELDSPLGFIG